MAYGNAVVPSALKTASASSSLPFGAESRGPLGSLSTLRSFPSRAGRSYGHARLAYGRLPFARRG